MSTIGKSGIQTSINDNVLTGGRRTTAPKVRTVLGDINDSNFNIVDGGLVVQAESGYSTAITPSSDYSWATKKYVDDNSTSVNPRYFRTNFAATLTPDIDSYDLFIMTAVTGTATINAPTGAAREGREICFRFTPTGSSQTLSWNVIFIDENVTIPTSATLGETTEVYFHYNEALTKWMCVGTNSGGGSGSGTVNSGNANELAYYAAPGTSVSGLTTANNSILVTDGSSVPSLSQTIPTAVQSNITGTGTVTSGVWNSRVKNRVDAVTNQTSYTPNVDNYDVFQNTGLTSNVTINNPTGTPNNSDVFVVILKDTGTPSLITWGSNFASFSETLPASTTANKELVAAFMYMSLTTKYECLFAQSK